MSIQSPQQISVAADGARVLFTVGRHSMSMDYNVALDIARALRVSGSATARIAGLSIGERSALKRSIQADQSPLSPHRNPTDSAGQFWRVSLNGKTVSLFLGNVEIGLEGHDALQIGAWLRQRAKQAKANAGDKSREWRAAGFLTDAEENYRLGIA